MRVRMRVRVCVCVTASAQFFICTAAVGIFAHSAVFSDVVVVVVLCSQCNIFVWRFWRFFQHIVYYAKRKMQYFLLCRYVADKNIYNLAASDLSLAPGPSRICSPRSAPSAIRKSHANSCSSCAAAVPTVKKAETIKGSAIEANRPAATATLCSSAQGGGGRRGVACSRRTP